MRQTTLRAPRSRLRLLHALLLGSLLVLPARGAAQEREEILSYDVRIGVADGGRMDVTEAIAVRALGEEIRRGIYRDFPTELSPRPAGSGGSKRPSRCWR